MTQGKIFINTNPPSPAQCVVCYSGFKPEKSTFVDFNMNVEFYGAILLCSDCLTNAVALLDFVPGEQFRLAESQAAAAVTASLTANRKIRILESFVASYLSDPDFSIDSFIADNPNLSLFEGVEGGSDEGSTGGESDESGSSESPTV